MTPENTKWLRISQAVMQAGFSPCVRDPSQCKTKWNQILPDYKRLADYFSKTGRNVPYYWDMSSDERQSEGLPRHFARDMYVAIDEWFGNRPQIRPPHVYDVLSPTDSNYRHAANEQEEADDDQSDPEIEDPTNMSIHQAAEASANNTPPRSPAAPLSTPSRAPSASRSSRSPLHRPF